MRLGSVRSFFFENWGLKILSLAFATLLWMFVVGEKRSEVSLSVPLELTRVPADMVIVSPVPEAIRVRLNGPRTLIAAVNPQQLAVTLDLDGIQPGISAFEILPSRLSLPRGVEVTYLSPSVITLEADRKVRKEVPVKPRVRGTPAEGFEVGEVTVDPPTVVVEGPERVVKQLREVPTEFVDVSGLNGGVTRPAELALPDPTVRPVGQRTVRMEVGVRELRGAREILHVPVRLPGPRWAARPPAVNVKIEGGLRLLARLKEGDVTAAVEPFGDRAPDRPVPVTVTAPEGSQVVAVEPGEVWVEPLTAPPEAPEAPEAQPAGEPPPAPAEAAPSPQPNGE
ncbi:MAG: hypothetical protein Kow0092_07460 [Deferrisomatales bacterium]